MKMARRGWMPAKCVWYARVYRFFTFGDWLLCWWWFLLGAACGWFARKEHRDISALGGRMVGSGSECTLPTYQRTQVRNGVDGGWWLVATVQPTTTTPPRELLCRFFLVFGSHQHGQPGPLLGCSAATQRTGWRTSCWAGTSLQNSLAKRSPGEFFF
ncbi:hypothetical protein QBC47DRAFT_191906 [Echria macrotheca]|uniref:Uncharacterized protein n=1 Tax=Echria macrotheca TaxID=438768 RepID=A0AAJ0BGU2_9PEZI|nr:hypothetical protein QBC47DRAFT_191906 [Echria macrotheca]